MSISFESAWSDDLRSGWMGGLLSEAAHGMKWDSSVGLDCSWMLFLNDDFGFDGWFVRL
jgi:hypothetical protein